MRGRVIWIVLLASASGHPAQPLAEHAAAALVAADLAPSPYQPDLAPNPFDNPAPARTSALHVRRAPATRPPALAPSPYELSPLLPDPYGALLEPSARAAASTPMTIAGNAKPRALAPSPYGQRLGAIGSRSD